MLAFSISNAHLLVTTCPNSIKQNLVDRDTSFRPRLK